MFATAVRWSAFVRIRRIWAASCASAVADFSEGELSSSWVVGWNSSLITGSWNAAAKGRMPDQVVLEDITYSHNNTPASGHYLFITGTSTVDYTSFGEVALKGVNVHNGIRATASTWQSNPHARRIA